jgi:hypothetical protein
MALLSAVRFYSLFQGLIFFLRIRGRAFILVALQRAVLSRQRLFVSGMSD